MGFRPLRRLDSVDDYDAIVVGAGVIGLSCAWRLAEQGRKVAVFDPAPGRGATAVGAGMLAPVTEANWHDTGLIELNIRAAREWPAFAGEIEEKSGLSTGFRSCGTVCVAFDSSDKAALEEICEFEVSLGLEATWCAPSRLRELEPLLSPSVRGGVWAPGEHQVDNRMLWAALHEAAAKAGARMFSRRVDEVVVESGAVAGVRSDQEQFDASIVVVAAGHAANEIAGLSFDEVPAIRPVKGQIIRLATRDRHRFASANVRALVVGLPVYVVSREDGGVVVGATQEEKGDDTTVDAGALYRLLRDAQRVLPGIAELVVEECNAGLRPATRDHLPVIGASSTRGLLLALGHFRNGFLLADVTGRAIATVAASGEPPSWCASFTPRRLEAPVVA